VLTLIYLSSGLFFGWSLGASDAANIWGTAVATKMVRFRLAALICSLFVILGATISGAGASHTLGKLGAVNEIAGAFMVVLSAGLTVYGMTRLNLPVSTSQAIVGSIIGWNFFAGMLTDYAVLGKIVSSWITSLLLAGIFSYLLFKIYRRIVPALRISIFRIDSYIRFGLILLGAFGSYALGANNIANVMGVFVPISPFKSFQIGPFELTGATQLFLLGSLAIALGVYTYSERVMITVGKKITRLDPQRALVVILSTALVQFLFASSGLNRLLSALHLPRVPLVPVSSSQLVIGAIIGIGLAGHQKAQIQIKTLAKIVMGWITTPVAAALVTFFCLFVLQNVFDQKVYRKVTYAIDETVALRLAQEGVLLDWQNLEGDYRNAYQLNRALQPYHLDKVTLQQVFQIAEVDNINIINSQRFARKVRGWFTETEIKGILLLESSTFRHKWQLADRLRIINPIWDSRRYKSEAEHDAYQRKFEYLVNYFRVE